MTDARPAVPPVPPPPRTNPGDAGHVRRRRALLHRPLVHEPVGNSGQGDGLHQPSSPAAGRTGDGRGRRHRPRRRAPLDGIAHGGTPPHHHGGSSSTERHAARRRDPGPDGDDTRPRPRRPTVVRAAIRAPPAARPTTWRAPATRWPSRPRRALCWVDVTDSASGATLFGRPLARVSDTVARRSGPVTVVIGAPTVLGVMVNGSAVALPAGFQTPFTMKFVTAG